MIVNKNVLKEKIIDELEQVNELKGKLLNPISINDIKIYGIAIENDIIEFGYEVNCNIDKSNFTIVNKYERGDWVTFLYENGYFKGVSGMPMYLYKIKNFLNETKTQKL